MKIKVASKNPQKIQAVKDLSLEYDFLKDSFIEGVSVPSGVSDQPKSLEETVTGAKNRAKSAFEDCELSFGLESELMNVPETKSGQMDVCVCAIYDGKEFHLGLSSAFEAPKRVTELMAEGMNMSDACFEAGLTDDKNIGSSEGLIGLLTKNKITRLEYTKQAVATALIHLENRDLFNY